MTTSLAIDQSGMRQVNTAVTLRAFVDTDGPVTSALLVERTGLSRRTIELILFALVADGWVREVPVTDGPPSAGRPRKYYSLIPERTLVLSIVLHERRVRTRIADLRGTTVAGNETELPAGLSPTEVIDAAIDLARSALAAAAPDGAGDRLAGDRLAGVVVGAGGTVSADGVVLTSPVGDAWTGTDIRGPITRAFSVPVTVENDTNLIALSADVAAATAGARTFVLLTPGNRVSAGIVIDGALHRGFDGSAGELVRVSGLGVHEWHDHPVAMVTSPEPARREVARALIRAAAGGDVEAQPLVTDFFGSLTPVIAVIAWVIAPEVLVIGGDFEGLEGVVQQYVDQALASSDLPAMSVRVVALHADAALAGGVALALALVTPRLVGS